MIQIQFGEPPQLATSVWDSRRLDTSKNKYRDHIIRELSQHPGQWAVVSRHVSRPAASKVARVLRIKYPGYEFAATKTEEGGLVYARFIATDISEESG